MDGKVLKLARRDNRKILEELGFQISIIIRCYRDKKSYEVVGFLTDHSSPIDFDTGLPMKGRAVHVNINFETLDIVGYPLDITGKKEIDMTNDVIIYEGGRGITHEFKVEYSNPDYSLCYVTLQLIKATPAGGGLNATNLLP